MKNRNSSLIVLVITSLSVGFAGVAYAALDQNSTGYESVNSPVSAASSALTAAPATAPTGGFSTGNDAQSNTIGGGASTDANASTETAETKKAEKEKTDAQKKCEDAKNAQAERDSAASQKAVDEACKSEIDVGAKEPTSVMPDYMMKAEREKASTSEGFKLVDVKKQDLANVNTSKLLSDPNTKIGGNLKYTAPEGITGNKVSTIGVNTDSVDKLYNPAEIVRGGTGSGIVKCDTCEGGKYGKDFNDGSYKTDITSARTDSIQKWDWYKEDQDGFAKTYEVSAELKAKGYTSAQLQTADMMRAMGEGQGYSNQVIDTSIATAFRESQMDTTAQNKKSSAYGYGQYVGDTWLDTVKPCANRNDSFCQVAVLQNDIDKRETTFNNSASLQNKVGEFGRYDYINHYAGGMNADPSRINYAIDYYNKNKARDYTLANYAANGSSGGGSYVGSKDINIGGTNGTQVASTGNSGAGGFNLNTGVNIPGIGNVSLNTLLGGSAGTSGANNNALVASLVNNLFSGGSSAPSSGSSSGSSTTTTTTATTPSNRGYDVIQALREICGDNMSTTLEANMLKIKSCG